MQSNRRSTGEWKAKHDTIPPELVDTLFSKTLELAKDGLGPARIASQLHQTYSLRVSPGTLRHWMVGDRRPQRRNIFIHKPSKALSYIIGANLGDGCTLTEGWIVKLEVTDHDFAQTFNNCMAELFGRVSPNRILVRHSVGRLPMYIVKYSSEQLTRLLRLPLRKLLELAFAFPREFLRGFFDAEGHVDVSVSEGLELRIGVDNSDLELLMQVRSLLKKLKIASRVERKREAGTIKVIRGETFAMRRTSHSVVIGRVADIKRFAEAVGFSIERKTLKLKDALSVIETYEPKSRTAMWKRLYTKKGGEWIRLKPGL